MMVVYEVAFTVAAGPDSRDQSVRLRKAFATLPGLAWLDLYTPAAAGHDPYVRDGSAPAHLAMLAFASPEASVKAANAPTFITGLSELAATTVTAMRYRPSPVAGETSPAPLAAPFSYVVRYHRPAADEKAFVAEYLAGHPPLLGRLPGIRNVMCYMPLPWRHPGGPPPADYMLGNEVAFDDAAAFDAAMASPVRHDLRAHYRTLPPFAGRNTHFAMERTRLVG